MNAPHALARKQSGNLFPYGQAAGIVELGRDVRGCLLKVKDEPGQQQIVQIVAVLIDHLAPSSLDFKPELLI